MLVKGAPGGYKVMLVKGAPGGYKECQFLKLEWIVYFINLQNKRVSVVLYCKSFDFCCLYSLPYQEEKDLIYLILT